MSKKERKKLAVTAASEKPHNRLEIAKDWLRDNYVVRVNLLDLSKVSLSPTAECTFHYEHPVSEDDIVLHAYAEELQIPRNLLKMLLTSQNHMESYNPVVEYLESRRGKYKGPSQIDLLCSSLRLSQGKDGKESVERASYLVRKWLVATAACALGIRQNDVALGLVGEKAGIGKTTFFEEMVPSCLKEYYQVAQKDERLFPFHICFAQRFLLNFDEFAAITNANEQVFKLLMSAKEVSIKRPGSRFTETVPRVASCCFTSNKNHRTGGFIRRPDNGMLRRLAIIEVDSIDDYRSKFNVDQLWAEVMMNLDGGMNPEWTQDEYKQFVKENMQYVIESNALRLIKLYYRMPSEDEEASFMTAMEIVLQLKERKKLSSAAQQVNEVTVGQALSVLGFRSRSSRDGNGKPHYGYDIIPMFDK